jgi:hypothetical protein
MWTAHYDIQWEFVRQAEESGLITIAAQEIVSKMAPYFSSGHPNGICHQGQIG